MVRTERVGRCSVRGTREEWEGRAVVRAEQGGDELGRAVVRTERVGRCSVRGTREEREGRAVVRPEQGRKIWREQGGRL